MDVGCGGVLWVQIGQEAAQLPGVFLRGSVTAGPLLDFGQPGSGHGLPPAGEGGERRLGKPILASFMTRYMGLVGF